MPYPLGIQITTFNLSEDIVGLFSLYNCFEIQGEVFVVL
jgi:hypothetical protein